eukprot:gnl/Ergobibamus_cyprinoides/3627.p1 GENE.gnl/Ergobibamus_cyprinoides/3627~~gnl/Ergobibamus_cyprinoides/3627.p1  ORF type:complete len:310 (+),score=99.40 gnl/Ergobibamus_cyprinoides/3627:32-931(+)
MIGANGELEGVAPRAVRLLFELAAAAPTHTYEISCYMLELYNEQLVDLLRSKRSRSRLGDDKADKIDIKLDSHGMVYVTNVAVVPVASAAELLAVLDAGFAARATSATAMNSESSRSHLMFSILIRGTNTRNGAVTTGKLSLTDLAGSERQSKTGASGQQLKEALSINKSLSALGDVIGALTRGETHIPYRNNKLTRLLMDSLGGNAKTLMFVNVSPSDYNAEEGLSSLLYARRVKAIKNVAKVQVDTKATLALREEITRLRSLLADHGLGVDGEDVELLPASPGPEAADDQFEEYSAD